MQKIKTRGVVPEEKPDGWVAWERKDDDWSWCPTIAWGRYLIAIGVGPDWCEEPGKAELNAYRVDEEDDVGLLPNRTRRCLWNVTDFRRVIVAMAMEADDELTNEQLMWLGDASEQLWNSISVPEEKLLRMKLDAVVTHHSKLVEAVRTWAEWREPETTPMTFVESALMSAWKEISR